jgi:hypothetical protein
MAAPGVEAAAASIDDVRSLPDDVGTPQGRRLRRQRELASTGGLRHGGPERQRDVANDYDGKP